MEFLKNIFEKFDRKFLSRLNKKKKIYLGIFVSITAVLFWAFISAGVITSNFNRSLIKSDTDNQNIEVSSMIINESDKGQKTFEVYGETGNYSSNHKIANLSNLIGNFYKDNKVSMSFQSSKGAYNEATKDLEMYENTLIVLSNDVTISADKITYYSKTKNIMATGHVKINQNGNFISTANKAYVDADFKTFRIVGQAKTKIYNSGEDLKGK